MGSFTVLRVYFDAFCHYFNKVLIYVSIRMMKFFGSRLELT